jgi:hypothetical protein
MNSDLHFDIRSFSLSQEEQRILKEVESLEKSYTEDLLTCNLRDAATNEIIAREFAYNRGCIDILRALKEFILTTREPKDNEENQI